MRQLITSLTILATSIGLSLPASADRGDNGAKGPVAKAYSSAKGEVSDAYIAGRLVTAYTLSEHLSPFDIDIEVSDGAVDLAGTVSSAIERDLAVEIAKGIPAVSKVRSELKVRPDAQRQAQAQDAGFARSFNDATLTARVKSRLILNQNTGGLAINVDTDDQVVTLNGKVDTDTEAALAEEIAQNTDGVDRVINQLEVRPRAS